MLSRTLRRPQQQSQYGLLTHAQAQQLNKLSLDTLLRRLQSSSLTNPARSLEVHFRMQPAASSAPTRAAAAAASSSTNTAAVGDLDEARIPLRTALSATLLIRTGLRSDGGHAHAAPLTSMQKSRAPVLSLEEWSLLAANTIRHGLDGALTRFSVQEALTTIQSVKNQSDAMAGTAALIRLLEACVDAHSGTQEHGPLSALSLDAIDALVVAVESVWDGAEGWRAEEGDLSIYALFAQFLGLTVACVSTGDYHENRTVEGPSATTTSADLVSESRQTRAGHHLATTSTSPQASASAPVSRRWSEMLLPRIALTVDANLVVARCARLCGAVCQHLVNALTPPAPARVGDGAASSPSWLSTSTRRQASISEALRLCQIADALQRPTQTFSPVGFSDAASTTAVAATARHTTTSESSSPARTFIPAWLSFAHSTTHAAFASAPSPSAQVPTGTTATATAIPTSTALGLDASNQPRSSRAIKPEWTALQARVAAHLRSAARAHLTLVLSIPTTAIASASTAPKTNTVRRSTNTTAATTAAALHPALATLPLVDIVTLLQLACDGALSAEEASRTLVPLTVHISTLLTQLTRGSRSGSAGQAGAWPVPLPVIATHSPALSAPPVRPLGRPWEQVTTLDAIVTIGELYLSLDSRHGTASLLASVLQCVAQAAPVLWSVGDASSALWCRACALVDGAPLIARDATSRAFWALASAVAESSREESSTLSMPLAQPSAARELRRQGLLTLARFLVEEEETNGGVRSVAHHVDANSGKVLQTSARRALIMTTASYTVATPFSEQGVMGLKAAARSLHVFTRILETAAHTEADGALASQEVCWHAVVHTLENLQRLASQLPSTSRPWTSYLSASELSALRRALRWASAAPRDGPATAPTTTTQPPSHVIPAAESVGARDDMTARVPSAPHHSLGTSSDIHATNTTDRGVSDVRAQPSRQANVCHSHASRKETNTHASTRRAPSTATRDDTSTDHVAVLTEELHRQLVLP